MTTVLIIGKVWPEPRSSAAGSRMMQLIRFFRERNYPVFYGTAAGPSPYAEDLTDLGVLHFDVKLNHPSFDHQVRELNPGIVLFDRYMTEEQFGWRITENCPEALKILDTEDLHFLRAEREQAIKSPDRDPEFLNETAKRELASIYRCDLSLAISSRELELLRERFHVPAELLLYLPYLFDGLNETQSSGWKNFGERSNFISIGNYLHAPNLDAVFYLKQQIWPLIREKLPEAELHVYGAYGESYFEKLNSPATGFLIKGRASSSEAVMSAARVCLAPLRFGAGLKGKLAEAMRCGTPSVTTAVGAEGLGEKNNWPGVVTNDELEFVNGAVQLYRDEITWQKAADRIQSVHNAVFDRHKHESILEERIDDCIRRLPELRKQNITGALLSHNLQHAKRWLGKYLELKGTLLEKEQFHQKEK